MAPLAPLGARSLCRLRAVLRARPPLRAREGAVRGRARSCRCDRLAGRAACRRGRRVRVATERRAHRGAQSLLRRAAPLHLSGALDRARDAAAARGGRGCRSRCRRACRGSPLRAVHQHISDVRHVRRARALVHGTLAASPGSRHPVAGRRSRGGVRRRRRACPPAALVVLAGPRVPALRRRGSAGGQQDEASIDRGGLPGDHEA